VGAHLLAESEERASIAFDNLFEDCQNLVFGKVHAAVAGMLDKADESLAALAEKNKKREVQQMYQDARKAIAAQRRNLEAEFDKAFVKEITKRAGKAHDTMTGKSFADIGEISLSLMGDEDLQEDLKFKELAGRVRRICDEELAALDQRVGVVLGDAGMASEDNPFGAESICDAYKKACKSIEGDAKLREILLKLFDDHVVDAARSIYKEVNTLLVDNGILPKIKYGVKKKDGGPADEEEEEEAEEEKAEKGEGKEEDSEENLMSMLQSLVKSGGLGGGGPALPPGAVVLQGAELLGSLNNIQQQLQGLSLGAGGPLPEGVSAKAAAGEANVLKELKQTTFGAQMQGMDAATLDIVSLLFDQLFEDPKIPVALKGIIGRLQIPMLKVAIADKALFSKKSHPARQLLDTFGVVAVRLADDFNAESPTFIQLEAIIQHLVSNFQEDTGVFDRAREQLKELIADHDKKVEEASEAEAKRIVQQEILAAAKSAAEEEIKPRVQAHKLPGAVLEFIIQEWLRYMLVVFAKGGRDGVEWKGAIETMDQLIWSLEPVKTLEDRKKLAALVPLLVRKLMVGMNAVGVEPQVRERFMGAMMECHTVSLAKVKEGAPPPPPPPAPVAATPEQLDFTAPVSVPDAAGNSVNVVSLGLDFTPPKPMSKEERANRKMTLMSSLSVDPPNMEIGSWIEFRPKEEGAVARACKVLFISPKKTRYLFSDRRGKDVIELSRAEIVRRLRTKEAVRLKEEPPEPLFSKFMNGVMGKLKTPAPGPAA
jgi:hypothetical protein